MSRIGIVKPIRVPKGVEYTVVSGVKAQALAITWMGSGNKAYVKALFKKGFVFFWHDGFVWINGRPLKYDAYASLRHKAKEFGLKARTY